MLRNFIIVLVLTLVIDFLWVGLFMNRFYLEQFGEMARVKDGKFDVILWAAIMVYVILAIGITVFALPLGAGSIATAFTYGALLGFTVYGVYDFTNHATLKHWPMVLLAVDMAWGTFVCGTVAALTTWINIKFF